MLWRWQHRVIHSRTRLAAVGLPGPRRDGFAAQPGGAGEQVGL